MDAVPTLVQELMDFVEKQGEDPKFNFNYYQIGIETEGIFRVPGFPHEVKTLKKDFEKGNHKNSLKIRKIDKPFFLRHPFGR